MTTAYGLLKRGFPVVLYEASARLGGKAGSESRPPLLGPDCKPNPALSLPNGLASDHGYHVFPQWYVNIRHLWPDIGIKKDDVFEGARYVDLQPALGGIRLPFAPDAQPTLSQLLAICDLVLQEDERVDDLTLQAFLHSRDYYRTDKPLSLNDFILNALTIGDADISSRAVRDVFRQWLPVFNQPNWAGLRGSLQSVFIDRLEWRIRDIARLERLQCSIRKNTRVVALQVKSKKSVTFTVEHVDTGEVESIDNEITVLALPQDVLRKLDNPGVYEFLPEISRLHYLRSNPFSALDIHFARKLSGMPSDHFTLKGSAFGITGFDISQHWPGLEPNTVLQFVASNSVGFQGLDDSALTRAYSCEIARYFPEVKSDVAMYVPHRNFGAPLFVNDVGTWKRRPQTVSSVEGLYFAGDYTQQVTDVTSMEGAVRSGLMAADAIRDRYAHDTPPLDILPPPPLPPALLAFIELAKTDPVLARLQCLAWFLAQLATPPAIHELSPN
jgi:predicted NAD/FAD-dependent oxidoreductase